MFDGEDLAAGDRTKAQMDQCKDWWNQQTREKEAIKVRLQGGDQMGVVGWHRCLLVVNVVSVQPLGA